MPLIGVLQTLVDGQVITAAQHNSNYTDIKNAFNTSAVLTDVAKIITVTHTWNASQTFAAGVSFGGPITSHLRFTDATYDIGESATLQRPRDGFFSRHLTVGGKLLIGTTVISGAGDGEAVFQNEKGIRGVEAAGANTRNLIKFNAADRVEIGANAVGVYFPLTTTGVVLVGTTVIASAGGGDVIVRNDRGLRGVDVAGAATVNLIRINSADNAQIGGSEIYAYFPYTSGTAGRILVGTTVTTSSSGADVILRNNRSLRGVNAAGTDTASLIMLNTADVVLLGGGTQNVAIGAADLFFLDDGVDTYIREVSANVMDFVTNSVSRARFDASATATHTAMLLYDVDNAALERVTVGVADSGGAGFKVLRIPN